MTTDTTNVNLAMKEFDDYSGETLVNEAPLLEFAQLFPIVQVSEYAESVGNITVSYTGKAGINAGKLGEIIPAVGVVYEPDSTRVWDLAFMVTFEDRDIRATNNPQTNLDVVKDLADAGVDAYGRSLFELAMTGGENDDINGLANLPTGDGDKLVPTSAAAKPWKDATGDEILDDLNAGYSAVRMQTGNRRSATRIVTSDIAYLHATTKRVSNSSETALAAFNRNLREQGKPVPEMFSSIAFTADALFYDADERVIRMLMAHPLRYGNTLEQPNGFTRTGKYRFSSVQARQPRAMHKLTAVSPATTS